MYQIPPPVSIRPNCPRCLSFLTGKVDNCKTECPSCGAFCTLDLGYTKVRKFTVFPQNFKIDSGECVKEDCFEIPQKAIDRAEKISKNKIENFIRFHENYWKCWTNGVCPKCAGDLGFAETRSKRGSFLEGYSKTYYDVKICKHCGFIAEHRSGPKLGRW